MDDDAPRSYLAAGARVRDDNDNHIPDFNDQMSYVGPILPAAMPDPSIEKRFLPKLAEDIASWFPELGGRSIAVSDATITKENTPTLPLVMCAFLRGVGASPKNSPNFFVNFEDTIVIEFWMEPQRYKNDKGETPFWSYYPYEYVRDKLLQNLAPWTGPHQERLAYRTLHIAADAFAVTLTFGFVVSSQWCADRSDDEGEAFTIGFHLCPPPGICWPDERDIQTGVNVQGALSRWMNLFAPNR